MRATIMILLFGSFAYGANCPEPVVENYTETWTRLDAKVFKRARWRCGDLFPKQPCLKVFRKKEELVHQAICGEKEG